MLSFKKIFLEINTSNTALKKYVFNNLPEINSPKFLFTIHLNESKKIFAQHDKLI